MRLRHLLISAAIVLLNHWPVAAVSSEVSSPAVRVEVTGPMQKGALLHWRIINDQSTAIYVYSFYLWGPAYKLERLGGDVFLDTTPISEEPSCPPNRFPPVLLLAIGPGRTIEGDLTDSRGWDRGDNTVSMRIAAGPDPFSVVQLAKAYGSSRCKHSPYDAIVKWGKVIESNRVPLAALLPSVKE